MPGRNPVTGLALDTLKAAFTVSRWTLGMMLVGSLMSVMAATVLLDEATGWVRSGVWGTTATILLMLVLVVLPFVWSWLGRAHGIRLACLQLLGPRAEAAIGLLLRGVAKRSSDDGRPLSPEALLAALRKPSRLSGPSRWLAWLVRWQLDLDRTEQHLARAAHQAREQGQMPEQALAAALALDLGERWLQPDASLLWALLLSELATVLALAWLW